MKCEGYSLNGYDATYRKTLFSVNDKGNSENRVLEITDIESGTTFLLDLSTASYGRENHIRTWRKQEPRQEQHGLFVSRNKKVD